MKKGLKKVLKIAAIIFVVLIILSILQKLSSPPKRQKQPDKPVANLPSPLVWLATHETGDLSEWQAGTTSKSSQDSGFCIRPKNGVTDEVAHTGKYSAKMSIQSWFHHSGCRTNRDPEIRGGEPYYYSAWFYFPENYQIKGWSNIFQFKAKRTDKKGGSQLFWALRLANRNNGAMYFRLNWDQANEYSGPTAQDGVFKGIFYDQDLKNVEANQWIHVEMFLRQSSDFDGQIIVWQDGVEIYNVKNVRTKMPEGINSWSVNSYGSDIFPNPFTVYVDDAVVSTQRIGPSFTNFIK